MVVKVKVPVPQKFRAGINEYWPFAELNVTTPSLTGGWTTVQVSGSPSASEDGISSPVILVSSFVIKNVLVDTGHAFVDGVSQQASHHITWFPPESIRNM